VVRALGGPDLLPWLLRHLDDAGVAAGSAEVTRSTLDDVFLNLTGRSLREGGTDAIDPTDPTDEQEVAA
jgi:ABC-2 type transport system ATP-binding protein